MKTYKIAGKAEIIFGAGEAVRAAAEIKKAGCCRVFVLADPWMNKNGFFQPIYDALLTEELDFLVYDDFDRDPTDVMINKVGRAAVEYKADGLIGMGGGATMDITKCVNQLIHSEFPITNYTWPLMKTPNPGVPMILIPTTPGTGSETSDALSFIDTVNNLKTGNVTKNNVAMLSIIDPTFTLTMPDRLSAENGMDAMSHAIETILSANSSPFTDVLALEAFRLVWENLPIVLRDRQNLEARSNMSWAGLLSGIAYTDAQVHFGHFIIHAFGAKYHIGHGELCGTVEGPLVEFAAKYAPEKVAKLAKLVGVEPAGEDFGKETGARIREFARANGLRSLMQLGISPKEVMEFTQQCYNGLQSSGSCDPRIKAASLEEFTRLMKNIAADI